MKAAPSTSAGAGHPDGWQVMNFTPTISGQFNLAFRFLPDGAKSVIVLGKMALEHFLGTYALPLEIYLRWRWGTRGLTLFQVVFLVGLAVPFLSPVASPGAGPLGSGLALLAPYLVGAAGLSVWHYYEARRDEGRHKGPGRRYSYSWGQPLTVLAIARWLGRRGWCPRWLWNDGIVSRFVEPAIGLVLGTLFTVVPFTRALGCVLLASGAGLLLKRHILHLRDLEARRDRWDAITIGEHLSETADAEREDQDSGPVFEVRLAPAPLPGDYAGADPGPIDPGPLPQPEPVPSVQEPSPTSHDCRSSMLEARVLVGPDRAGRLKVECPGCGARIRCQTSHHAGSSCPGCRTGFVFALPERTSA